MSVSNKTYGISVLILSILGVLYMLFMLIIVPILPLDKSSIVSCISQIPLLLLAGISGFVFCGSLSVFTIFVMYKGRSTHSLEKRELKEK